MIYITAVHFVGVRAHETIGGVRWLNCDTGISKTMSTEHMVTWIDEPDPHVVQVGGDTKPFAVGVVHPSSGDHFLRTHADGYWTDDLLHLPAY